MPPPAVLVPLAIAGAAACAAALVGGVRLVWRRGNTRIHRIDRERGERPAGQTW